MLPSGCRRWEGAKLQLGSDALHMITQMWSNQIRRHASTIGGRWFHTSRNETMTEVAHGAQPQ